jgi:hypothetical protein
VFHWYSGEAHVRAAIFEVARVAVVTKTNTSGEGAQETKTPAPPPVQIEK